MNGNLLEGKLIEKTREDENTKITEHATTKKKGRFYTYHSRFSLFLFFLKLFF